MKIFSNFANKILNPKGKGNNANQILNKQF